MAPADQVKNIARAAGRVLDQAKGKDHLLVTTTTIENGQKTRVVFEEGLLKVLGSAPMLMMGL